MKEWDHCGTKFVFDPLSCLKKGILGISFILALTTLLTLPAFAGSVNLPRTGQTNCYDPSGAVIPCAGTGQDGEFQAGLPWPVPRFTDHGDGTVTDKLTGLMWTQSANVAGFVYWPAALAYVAGMNAGTNPNFGYTDWHLPNINELYSLVDAEHAGPVLPPGAPFVNIGIGTNYWASTTTNFASGFEGNAWTLDMRGGAISSDSKVLPLGNAHPVWPVRDSGTPGPAAVPSTGQVHCYDGNGTLIACAGTGQDGDIKAGVPWPMPRFTDNADGTITDNLTALMWLKNASPLPTNPSGWLDALDYVAGMNAGVYPNSGYTDWRLSNRRELNSLKKYEGNFASPALPVGPNPYAFYWTSTTAAGAPVYDGRGVWYFYWYTGQEFPYGGKFSGSVGYQMWPVRGGQVGPPSLVSIDVTPADPTIDVGQTRQFMATGTFSDGSFRVLTPGADSWTNRAPMPSARGQLASGVINDIIYAIGGFFSDPSYITYATLEAYDPSSDSWSPKTSMPTPRSSLGAGVVNGILYAVGGQHNSSLSDTVEAYDPATDTWTTKASLPNPTSEVGIGVVGGMLYAVGGYNGGGTSANLEAYDPVADIWTPKAPMPTPRSGPTVDVVNGILYAIGGNVGQTSLSVVEAYNPATDSWTTKAPIPSARCCMGSGVIDGIIYVAGGFNSLAAPSYVSVFEAYDPATDTWTTKDPVPTNVFGNAVGVVNNVLYSIGGFSPGVPPTYDVITLDAVYAYAPLGEVTWSSLDTGVATIDPIGLATGLGPGATTITATSISDPGISGNTTLTVNIPTHILTLATAGSGSGTVGGAGTYNEGDTAAVTANPDAGSIFDGWTGSDAAECATGSVLMDADKICTVHFTLNLPDLIMTAVTPNAATVNQGGTLSASDTVMNQGPLAAGTFRIAYHLSIDNIYGNGDDVVISTIRVVTSLGAGASNTATTNLSIPSNAPGGTYQLCAMADSVFQMAESDETNNALCSGATVTLPKADLVMTAVSTATTVIAPGKTLSLSNSVKNQGGFGAGSFTIGFYLSYNSDGSTQDASITTTRTLSSLGIGSTSTASTTFSIPSNTSLGTYYVCAMADSGQAVPEEVEINNVLCTGGTIQVSLPDLSMTDVTPNASTANPGGTLSVTTTVSNGGSASGAFRIGFRLSPTASYDDSGAVVITTTRSVSSLAAGASSTGTTNLTIPGATPSGDYYVCTLADSLSQVAEADELNNTLCSGSQVNVP
jgi:N-acetylneuraminic acid mutarotase